MISSGIAAPSPPDAESRAWIAALDSDGPERAGAVARLHQLLLGAARFEVNRRGAALPHLRGGDLDDIAQQSADDALVAVLAKLATFRGDSRFTTWAYKFALLEAAVALRKRAWQNRELPLTDDGWARLVTPAHSPHASSEGAELLGAVKDAIATGLSEHQREVLVATTLNDVPIDVLADRLGTTRGALYKVLHDARRKLRDQLGEQGFSIGGEGDA